MPPIRILVVDDSTVIRKVLCDGLAGDAALEVVGTAANGRIALSKIPQVHPDLVTLDVEMPEMNGLETLAAIRKIYPKLRVIMFSTLTERGASTTLDALALGASDYVTKPSNTGSLDATMRQLREQLIPKIKALCEIRPSVPVAPVARRSDHGFTAEQSAVRHGFWPNRCAGDRNIHGRAQCAGRTAAGHPCKLSGSDRDCAAHAAVVYAVTRRAVEPAFRFNDSRRRSGRDSPGRRGVDRAGKLPYDGGKKRHKCGARSEPEPTGKLLPAGS